MYIDIKNNTPGKVPEVLIWWGWWDLNPHDLWSADFESAASAIPPQPRLWSQWWESNPRPIHYE